MPKMRGAGGCNESCEELAMIKPWVFGFLPERKPSSGFLTSEPLLALASLDLACRDHCPGVSATFTTTAFDHSGSRWLGISDLITEPEGPSGCKQPFDRRSTIEQAMAVTASCHQHQPDGWSALSRQRLVRATDKMCRRITAIASPL